MRWDHGRQLDFEEAGIADKGDYEPTLVVDVDGFSGPLDLLLELARRQKVDLQKISVLALAEQYLVFIEEARKFRLELAADYLVMAAWLAYLKSAASARSPQGGRTLRAGPRRPARLSAATARGDQGRGAARRPHAPRP